MRWHEECADAKTIAAAERLARAAPGFYLAGGTALALRLGHRISLDLDLFSRDNALGAAERRAIQRRLEKSGAFKILESKDGACHFDLKGVSVSLFHYPYRLLGRTAAWRGLKVAALEDVAAMKLGAVIGRGSRKDFVDLYFLSRLRGWDWLRRAGKRKFPRHADFALQAAKALVYFADAEKEPLPRLLAPLSWGELKSRFEREAPRSFLP
ncbi:MAG TPA: nucleotidyl transferase AbiEii/AbiGii toxin family protein [Elusimicrobiota bacterium]|nr:nucleotidyl transferase AbiEii/AbiGii toxin family protein [Elusimicrobiota bacterium]